MHTDQNDEQIYLNTRVIHGPTLDVDWNGAAVRLPGVGQSSSSVMLIFTPLEDVRIPQLPTLRQSDNGTTPYTYASRSGTPITAHSTTHPTLQSE